MIGVYKGLLKDKEKTEKILEELSFQKDLMINNFEKMMIKYEKIAKLAGVDIPKIEAEIKNNII